MATDRSLEATKYILLDRVAIHQRARDRHKKKINPNHSTYSEEMYYNHKETIDLLEDVIFRIGAY